ncbi:hypothetical protein LSAT2_010708 [Lamellibrachia satsuma]|nr:hypothetical protein LSAT2_010708 [Lamellibrachia satsuma]
MGNNFSDDTQQRYVAVIVAAAAVTLFVTRSRHRRSCSGTTYSVDSFIKLVEKIEKEALLTSTPRVAAYLRLLGYSGLQWIVACGTIGGTVYITGLDDTEIKILETMMGHKYNATTSIETGVALTRNGTVALGHVIAGIDCGGFNRDTSLFSAELMYSTKYNLDNLFVTTLSGDIGQTTLAYNSFKTEYYLFGPACHWVNPSCPDICMTKPNSLEGRSTDAEVLGNIDGFILGTIMPMIKNKNWKLSEIFCKYYKTDGIKVGERVFSSANRAVTIGELVSDVELTTQSYAYAQVHYKLHRKSYGNVSLADLLKEVPSAVQTFYDKYIPCEDVMKNKYTIFYFVKLVKELEKETKFGIKDMTRAILLTASDDEDGSHKYTDGFVWYVMRYMMLHSFPEDDRQRELGVVDAAGDTVAIGRVLAGIDAGIKLVSYTLSTLHRVTVAGSLASAADRTFSTKTPTDIIGATGSWDRSSCPPKYILGKKIKPKQHTTRAELLGGIDGFVLGVRVSKWLEMEPHLKLSALLERYYGGDYKSVSSKHRLDKFKKSFAKGDTLANRMRHSCKSLRCKIIAKEVVNTFYKMMSPSVDDDKSSTGSQFLPDYRTLVAVYPGDNAMGGSINGVDLREKLSGNLQLDNVKTLAATDGLRLSYMLNQLDGHHIPKDNSQGAFIGIDEKVYIYDLAALKLYLTKKYGDPLTASSASEVTGQSGILILDVSQTDRSAGSVGLWDGKNMHQIKDYTKASSVRPVTLWVANGCTSLKKLGDCKFYECLDSKVHGKDDYALSYGFRYCQRFSNLYNDFNSDGKKWVKNVKICLMEEVATLYKGIYSRGAIKKIAFNSHADCYVKSGSFCKMASDLVNWDALFNVFKPQNNELWKNEDRFALEQVFDTMRYCNKKLSATTMKNLKRFNKRGHDKMRHSISSKHQDEGSKIPRMETARIPGTVSPSRCINYANSGDCRFYQCFQQRFPCNVFGVSHLTDFELPSCKDMEAKKEFFELQVTYL